MEIRFVILVFCGIMAIKMIALAAILNICSLIIDYISLSGASLLYCQLFALENTSLYPNTLSTRCSTMGIDSCGGKPL